MGPVPDCLKRRYTEIDGLISELSAVVSNSSSLPKDMNLKSSDPGIKLMCQFWNILKEDPKYDLKKAVLDKMESNMGRNSNLGIKNYSCFMAMEPDPNGKMPASTAPNSGTPSSLLPSGGGNPGDGYLSKVLCDLQEAATYDKECCAKIEDLKAHQQHLMQQIQELEGRENDGVKMLKKADIMWSCMEDAYKHKIGESVEMQKQHLREQREFEQSLSKWRQHKKDLEGQVKNLDKCRTEIKHKIEQKTNDLKFIHTEIEDLKKKILTTDSDADALNKSLISKQQIASEKQIELGHQIKILQQDLEKEKQAKADKEADGRNCIKQAREDLQKICTKLLQKRMENEDFKAEREAILSEIQLLKATSVQCQERCENRKANLADELALVEEELANYKLKCSQCSKSVDTVDVRRFCTDCPRCMQERECLYDDDICTENPENECVCMTTKRKFLDNVFENMYNVLAAQVKSKNGKALAEQIFDSLKQSRNGKLSDRTRKAVQEFILAVVKKNLNLTIIGGAVKTRCEMEPSTYEQLMLCLKTVEVQKPAKEEKGTVAKKEPCKRWGVGECNCPKGPAGCICMSKAHPTSKDPQPCPPRLEEDYFDIGQAKKCPIRVDKDCGADCAVPLHKSDLPELIARAFHPQEPCGGVSCPHSKKLKSADCNPMCTVPPPDSGGSSKYSMATSKNKRGDQCEEICMRPPGFKAPLKVNMDTKVETKAKIFGPKPPVGQKDECVIECGERRANEDESKRSGEPSAYTKNMKDSRTSSKFSNVDSKGSQRQNEQTSDCSKVCPDSQSKGKKNGSHRSGESSTFSKNMRAAQCALGPCPTQDYVDYPSNFLMPYRKLIAKGPKESSSDWKSSSNVGTEALKSYSPVPNNCDCELRRERKENEGQSCRTALISKKSSDHGKERRGIIKGKYCLCSERIEVDLMPSKFGDVPQLQAEVLSGANVGREPYVNFTSQERKALEMVLSDLTKPHISEDLKVTVSNDKVEVEQEFKGITVTSSGSTAMALDEKIIEDIENLTEENQVFFGNLRKTFSGHYALEFNKSAPSSGVSRQVVVKKKDSGHIIMEIRKDIINTLRPGANTQVMAKESSMSLGVTKEKGNCQNKCYETGHEQADYKIGVKELNGRYDKTRQSFIHSINQFQKCDIDGKKSCKKNMRNHLVSSDRSQAAAGRQKSFQSYNTGKKKHKYTAKTSNILYLKDEFQKMFENGHTAFNVTTVGENGLKSIIRARITKTPSRHIAVDVKALENIGQIANRLKNYPVSLNKTKSKYLLKLARNNEKANALLRRSSIGDMLVVLKDPIMKYPGNMSEVLEVKKAVFVVRVKGIQVDDSDEPSILLRVTSSGNFVFIFDKEFEETYMTTVSRFGPDKCPLNLSINKSGVSILDFKSCDIESNGLLVKTRSGKLKIFSASPKDIGELQLYRSTVQTDVYELFSKLYRDHLKTKCCSETLFNGKKEMYEQRRLISDEAAILKKTGFGRYVVVLNKDSEVLFLHNVKKFISNTGNFLVPIKVGKDGELIICLSHDHEGIFGSVRISNSGNIYVLIDDNVIKDIGKNAAGVALSESSSGKTLKFIGSLVDTSNKREPTSSLVQDGECYDDKQYNYEKIGPETSSQYIVAENSPTSSFNRRFPNHYDTALVSKNRRCSEEDNPSDSSPTGILRTGYLNIKKQNNINKSISWKDIIDEDVAHGKIDFNKERTLFFATNKEENFRPDISSLDYMDSMPPQLPSFLRNFI